MHKRNKFIHKVVFILTWMYNNTHLIIRTEMEIVVIEMENEVYMDTVDL